MHQSIVKHSLKCFKLCEIYKICGTDGCCNQFHQCCDRHSNRCGVNTSVNSGVGTTMQMCNRVTNTSDMGIFSKWAQS